MFEIVHTVTDYFDGPRAGVADVDGVAHFFQSVWDDERDDYSDTFLLTPIDAETLALALEDWAIWLRWEDAFHKGIADEKSHPALPSDRERHEELKVLLASRLRCDPQSSIRKIGKFQVRAGVPERPPGACRDFEVFWDDPA